MLVFGIKDEKAESFLKPLFDKTKGRAAREFGDMVLNAELPFGTHPEDYSLYYLGDFDEKTGLIKPVQEPELVCRALDYKSK